MARITAGFTSSIWRSRYGRQAAISSYWGTRFSGGRHLTTLQMNTRSRGSSIAARILVSSSPAGPTNGRPVSSSQRPGPPPPGARRPRPRRGPYGGVLRTSDTWCTRPRARRWRQASRLAARGRSRTDRHRGGRRTGPPEAVLRGHQLTPGASPGCPRCPRCPRCPGCPGWLGWLGWMGGPEARGWAGSPSPPPAASAVRGIRAPVPARRSRQRLLHRVEDSFRHVALVEQRQRDRRAALPDDRDAIRGDFKPRAGLVRVVEDDVVETLLAQLRLGAGHPVFPLRLQCEPDHHASLRPLQPGEDVGRRFELERERAAPART